MQRATQALFKSINQIHLSKYLLLPARMLVLGGAIGNIMQQKFIQIQGPEKGHWLERMVHCKKKNKKNTNNCEINYTVYHYVVFQSRSEMAS